MKDGNRWACNKNSTLNPPHPPYFEEVGGTQSFNQIMAAIPKSGTQSQNQMPSLLEIQELGVDAIRDVPKDIVAFYGVKIAFDQTTGQQLVHYYPITSQGKVVSYHIRQLPKSFFHLHKRDQLPDHLDMFGMLTVNIQPTYIVITEGEIDAMAAFVMLAGHKGVKKIRCLSLPTGNNLLAVQQNLQFLRKTNNLYFCPDQDDAGKKLIPDIWKMLPNIKIMEYSEKDADDMLRKGKTDEFYESFTRAQRYRPSSVVSAAKIKTEAMEPVQMGLSYPFPTLNQWTYGLRKRRLIGIGAGPGTGKTVLAQTLVMHIVYALGSRAAVFSLEEQPAESMRRMAGHIMGLPIHLPNAVYDPKQLSDVLDSLDGRLFYYDHSGYRDWGDVEEVIRFMAFEGVEYFFIDPLSALHTHLDASATNQFLNKSMFAMSRMIHELNITIFHINHLNNPMTGKDHNEGGAVKASQFTGSRSQWRFSTDVWGLSRDATNEDPVIANTTIFSILKNRLSGMLGNFYIRYNHSTGRLEEVPLSTVF